MTRGTVVVMAKAPSAGAVKTRLAADVGVGRATALYRQLLRRTIAAALGPAWNTLVAVDRPHAFKAWSRGLDVVRQSPGDLGARMAAAATIAGAGPVVIVGADAPQLRRRHFAAAFRALAVNGAVFGPAEDGGYWLVGLKRPRDAACAFSGVRWSGPHALADTLANVGETAHIAFLETLRDLDDEADLAALGCEAFFPSRQVATRLSIS